MSVDLEKTSMFQGIGRPPSRLRRGITRIVDLALFPFGLLLRLGQLTLAILLVLSLLANLVLPVLVTVSQSLFAIAATVAESVLTGPNLVKRQAAKDANQHAVLIEQERAARKAADNSARVARNDLRAASESEVKATARAAKLESRLGQEAGENVLRARTGRSRVDGAPGVSAAGG